MEEILSLAKSLGEAIRKSERFKRMRELDEKVQKDEECRRIVKMFNEKSQAIREKEKNLQPVDVSEKRELADLEGELRKNKLLQELLRTQADYSELINKVNERIFTMPEPGTPQGNQAAGD